MRTINERYELVAPGLLHPHPHNPNIGDQAAIADSVEVNGFYGAVTVRDHPGIAGEYEILAGEHRWRTAIDQGATEIPVIVVSADDVTAARVLLADNETARRGRYDGEKLSLVLDELGDIAGTGFDLSDLSDFEDERAATARAAEEGLATDDGGDEEPEFVREFGIVILVDSEAEQEALYNELLPRGFRMRVASI